MNDAREHTFTANEGTNRRRSLCGNSDGNMKEVYEAVYLTCHTYLPLGTVPWADVVTSCPVTNFVQFEQKRLHTYVLVEEEDDFSVHGC